MSVHVALESSLGWILPVGVSPPSPVAAALHALAALLCGVAAVRGSDQGLRPWTASVVLLLGLALNCLLHLDQQFVLGMRELAGSQGWYAWRRPLQLFALAVLVAAAALAIHGGARLARGLAWDAPSWCVSAGMGMLLILFMLRFVSLHHTDLLLDARMAGASLGRWLETVALIVVGTAAIAGVRTRALPGFKEIGRV